PVPGTDADPGADAGLCAQDHRHLHNHAAAAALSRGHHGRLHEPRGRHDYRGRLMTIGLDWLPNTAFLYLLMFARIGDILMLMPALGEDMIPARMRLSFALAFTLVVYPLLSPSLPAMPDDFIAIAGL